MGTFFRLFAINFVIGIIYSLAYFSATHILGWKFLTSSFVINIIGSLQGCFWYYYGEYKERKNTDNVIRNLTQ